MPGNLYLTTAEFTAFGLADSTDPALIRVVSDLVDAYCQRDSLLVAQYSDRNRLPDGLPVTRTRVTPLAMVAPATTPFISVRARHGIPRGSGGLATLAELLAPFGGPPTWVDLTPSQVEHHAATGEVWLPASLYGGVYTEVEITYNAGFSQVPENAKLACAQMIRNIESHPAASVREARLDRLKLAYFQHSLLDEDVRRLLSPFVAVRLN